MRNFYVSFRGGANSRAGTAFVGYSKQTGRSYPPRLVTFSFNIFQGLDLEFGHRYMRVIFNGAFVLETAVTVTGITRANPGVVTAAAHGFSNGDWVYLSGIVGMTQVNGQTYVVAGATTNTFQLNDVFGNSVNTAAFSAYISGGTVARVYTLTTPYSEVDLPWLKWKQSADVMSLCCINQQTGTEYLSYDLARVTDDDWSLTQIVTTQSISPPVSCTAYATTAANGTQSSTHTAEYPTAYAYVVTAISETDGQESVASPIANVLNSVDISATAGSLIIQWPSVQGAKYYNIYKAPPSFNSNPGNLYTANPVPAGSLFGFAGTSYGNSFTDSNITEDLSQVPPLHVRPFTRGAIVGFDIISQGSGLSTVTVTVPSATGTGFVGTAVIINGMLQGIIIVDGGSGYDALADSFDFNGASSANGGIDFSGSGNPADADTITLNGFVITFKTVVADPTRQVLIGGTLGVTLQNLLNFLATYTSSVPPLQQGTYVLSPPGALPTQLEITATTVGPGQGTVTPYTGNFYTLAASAAAPSGATLTGGMSTGAGTLPSASLLVGPQSGTYPGVVSYFQERRFYAYTLNNPDTYFASQPGAFLNFDSRIPTIDSDAIIGSPWSVEVNGIQWLVSMPGGLVALTGLQAWQLTGVGGSSLNPQPITPANQQAQPQAYNGCSATVPPIQVNNEINYVQQKGYQYYDFSYNFFVNIYTGQDITYLSSHLFLGYQILEMAWCQDPAKVIWAARSDGILLSLTYYKEQDVMGWARHDTQGQVWSVSSVTEPPVDALYLAVERTFAGGDCYMIERMDNRIWAANENCWCVDAGLSLPQPTPSATLKCSSANGLGQPNGVVALIGGKSYSAGTTAQVLDASEVGTGATAHLTIGAGGAITAVAFVGGTGYQRPYLVVTDPAATGNGFSAQVTLNNTATFTASAASFSAGSVGSVIRMGGGIATVTGYTSSEIVTGNITQPIVSTRHDGSGIPLPATAGNWSITAPTATVTGLNHLAGATVTGVADGVPIPPTVVSAAGTIVLATPASAIIVGLAFMPQLQLLPVDTGQPTIQGRRKKIAAITARVEASGSGVMMGSNQPDGSAQSPQQIAPIWTGMAPAPSLGVPVPGSAIQPLYTGDVRIPVNGGNDKPGQAALTQTMPLPLNVTNIVMELVEGDLPEGPLTPKQQMQQGARR